MTDREAALAEHKENARRNRMVRPRYWKYSTVVLLIVLIIGVYLNASGFTMGGGDATDDTVEDPDAVDKAISYINTNMLAGLATAELVAVTKQNDLYKLDLKVKTNDGLEEDFTSYVSLDGNLLIPAAVDITSFIKEVVEIEKEIEEEEVVEEEEETQEEEETEEVEAEVVLDPVLGNPEAPLTLTVFSDFECGFCGDAYWTLKLVEEDYPDDVKIVFKNFPEEFNDNAQRAAEASECAFDQGMFWEYYDVLYENQDALTADDLKQYAADLELDSEVFDECLDSGEKSDEVLRDVRDGQDLGVTTAPTFLIGDQDMLVGDEPFSKFQIVIDLLLDRMDNGDTTEETTAEGNETVQGNQTAEGNERPDGNGR